MKSFLTALLLLAGIGVRATVILSQSFSGGPITEGDPTGITFTGNFNTANTGDDVLGLAVHLNVTGGYVGDYYAFLVAPDRTHVTLMNQPGTDGYGAPATGLDNVILASGSFGNIQDQNGTTGVAFSGTYNALGNLADFGTVGSPGGPANGTWTLFFADLGSGGGSPDLTSWSLDVTVVPEPVPAALAVFAGVVLACAGWRWLRHSSQTL